MNYELAKELKDAGFPFRISVDPENDEGDYFIFGSLACRVPTLSELIEACGSMILFDVNGKWIAAENYIDENAYGDHYIDGSISNPQEGSTPSEAVARLWLTLNTK